MTGREAWATLTRTDLGGLVAMGWFDYSQREASRGVLNLATEWLSTDSLNGLADEAQ